MLLLARDIWRPVQDEWQAARRMTFCPVAKTGTVKSIDRTEPEGFQRK